jgi:hypothetical protein
LAAVIGCTKYFLELELGIMNQCLTCKEVVEELKEQEQEQIQTQEQETSPASWARSFHV